MRASLTRLLILASSLQFVLPVGWCCFVGAGACCPMVVAAATANDDACPCCPKPETPAKPAPEPTQRTLLCCERPDAIPLDVSDVSLDLDVAGPPSVPSAGARSGAQTFGCPQPHGADPPLHLVLCRWLC